MLKIVLIVRSLDMDQKFYWTEFKLILCLMSDIIASNLHCKTFPNHTEDILGRVEVRDLSGIFCIVKPS